MWNVQFIEAAENDFNGLDDSQKKQVLKALQKVRQNPLPKAEGGLGSPLGHRMGINLTGLLKIKLLGAGLRIVYKLEHRADKLRAIIISVRTDAKAYQLAEERMNKLK